MCWLENSTGFYLFDFETMQLHNINTGYRRSIRFGGQSSSLIDLTDDSNAASNSGLSSVANETERGVTTTIPKKQKQEEEQAAGVCGPAFEGGWLCGPTAERKLAELRQVTLERSPLVSEMKRLPQSQQLFDPVPIPPSDARFPIEQIKHLKFGGITVHEVRPTRMWKRNRSHFDLLLQEERRVFSPASKNPDNTPKLVHFGWHGAPAQSIRGILECGFLSVPTARVGRIHGHGIYLSTETHARYTRSDRFSVPDSAGFKYILLCEVLPGSVEVSERGQTHPSSKIRHSGVDRLPNASMHIFYTYDMNVRISPKFLICIHPKVSTNILGKILKWVPLM